MREAAERYGVSIHAFVFSVLVSEEDWQAIQETLYLLSVPNMSESIREGMNAHISECGGTLNW